MSTSSPPDHLWRTLRHLLSTRRQERMIQVAGSRTHHIRLVLADVHDPHNISAALRSAEALGIQNIDILHLPEEAYRGPHRRRAFKASAVACGIEKWLHIHNVSSPQDYKRLLRRHNYRLYGGVSASSSEPTKIPLLLSELAASFQIPPHRPLAIMFGNEHAGIHPAWTALLEGYFTIPTSGFVESMNISVAAAITMHHLTTAARLALGPRYMLSAAEQQKLLSHWIAQQFPHWQQLLTKLSPSFSSAPEQTDCASVDTQ